MYQYDYMRVQPTFYSLQTWVSFSNRTYSSYDFFQQMAQYPVNGVKKWVLRDHTTEASGAKASAS